MLLVNRSLDSWRRMLVNYLITMGFTYTLPSWYKVSPVLKHFYKNHSKSLRENNNNVIVFHFPFHIIAIRQLVFHPPSRKVSYPKDKKFICPLHAIDTPRNSLALGRGRIHIPGFFRITSTLPSTVLSLSSTTRWLYRHDPFSDNCNCYYAKESKCNFSKPHFNTFHYDTFQLNFLYSRHRIF